MEASEKMTLPPGTFLRLKRSAAEAALDELSVLLPVAKRERRNVQLSTPTAPKGATEKGEDIDTAAKEKTGSTPAQGPPIEAAPRKCRTLRFRRLPPEKALRKPEYHLGAQAKRKFIDLHMSAVVRSGSGAPELGGNGVAMARSSEFVYDIFAPVEDDTDESADEKEMPARRTACIDSSLLPAELFWEIDEGGEVDDPDTDDEERSVDYPSTPESSEDGLGRSSDDEVSDSSSFEDRALEFSGADRYLPFGVSAPRRTSRRMFAFDGTSDYDL